MATQLSLGSTLLPDLAKTFGGDGGGHDAAGGAKIATTDTDAVMSAILTAVESTVGETFTEV
jgi:nanoRNase/pAp phosphatase (c-di-AMP/oligoRNAs hydrolase)